MKEDILEQLVDDYLQLRGYFTRHNVKFRPRGDTADFIKNQDSNHSDIDVLGFSPHLTGPERIWVVSCKSWQAGFRVVSKIAELEENKIRSGREAWKGFRELMIPKWTDAFFAAVEKETGSTTFTYVTAVTAIHGAPALWENHPRFREALRGNPIKLLSLAEILAEVMIGLSTTVAPSSLGRTLQLLKASGYLRRLEEMMPNRVAGEVALPSPHTTEQAGPHSAVQAGYEAREVSLKAGSMTLRRRAVARCGPGSVEVVIPPPCPPWSVLHSAPWAPSYYDLC